MEWKIGFYRDKNDKEPVKGFLNGLSIPVRANVKLFNRLSEYGVLLKEPYTRQIKGKIRELRIKDSQGAINHFLSAAIFYIFRHRPKWSREAAVGKTVVSSKQ